MQKKKTLIMSISILVMTLLIGTMVTPAIASLSATADVTRTGSESDATGTVYGDSDVECTSCGGYTQTEGATAEQSQAVQVEEPPNDDPPCYTCMESVVYGLSDATAFVISIIPPIQDYVDVNDPGWMWLWLDALANSIIENNLVMNVINIFDGYGYIPGTALVTAAINAFVDDIWPLLESLADKIENGQIEHAVLTAVLGAPILAQIFMFSAGVEFLKICLDFGGDNQNAGDVGAGDVGSTEFTGDTGAQSVDTGDTQSASAGGSAGSMSL